MLVHEWCQLRSKLLPSIFLQYNQYDSEVRLASANNANHQTRAPMRRKLTLFVNPVAWWARPTTPILDP